MALIILQGKEKGKEKTEIDKYIQTKVHFHSQQSFLRTQLQKYYKHPFTTKKLGKSIHIRCQKGGFQIQLKDNKVETVFVYFRTPKMDCFEQRCYLFINKGWNIKGTVYYLGQPPIKNTKMMEIIYPHLGLGIVFQGMWSNELSLIDYAYIYERQGTWSCAGCGKDQKTFYFKCNCQLVKYCSKKCKERHYGHHLIFCEEGDPK